MAMGLSSQSPSQKSSLVLPQTPPIAIPSPVNSLALPQIAPNVSSTTVGASFQKTSAHHFAFLDLITALNPGVLHTSISLMNQQSLFASQDLCLGHLSPCQRIHLPASFHA